MSTVSIYTGAGGLDCGFEAAGFSTRVAVDNDRDSCETLRANTLWPVIEKAIASVTTRELLDAAGLGAGNVDLLIGGPPCQPFSKSGYWHSGSTKRLDDSRADTLASYFRCLEELLPKVFVIENVHGISYTGKEEGFRFICNAVHDINVRCGTDYQFTWAVTNSADYGVPQLRTRFILVGHREGGLFTFPQATHVEESRIRLPLEIDHELLPYVTAWDAIGKLSEPRDAERLRVRGKWADLLPSIPEGENYLWHTDRKGGMPLFGWRRRFWSFLLKLAKRLPSWTIQAQPGPAIGPFHWENRRLSASEMACIQTFPQGIRFAGSYASVQRQIGNAVPSLLAEVLARQIGEQFFGFKYSQPPSLIVNHDECPPPPEPVQDVPARYHAFVGMHDAHPGTGRGYMYGKGITRR